MKRRWELKPNLVDCVLEERIAPAISNLGIIILTTSGLTLVTPFPGAVNLSALASGGGGTNSTAPSVSGTAMPTSFYITGNRGISTFMPGNFTGNPAVGGAAGGTSGGVSLTIQVGSGANEASAPVATPTVSRNTVGGSARDVPAIMAYIGQPASGSGSPVLPESDSYRAPKAPVPALPPPGLVLPGSPPGSGGSGMTPAANPSNPQAGAPMFSPGVGGRAPNPLPGGLGVGSGSFLPGPGPN